MIVTSMVDLNSLRGFLPNLASIPTLVYCHENQFDYPLNEHPNERANRLNAQLSSIFSMAIADKVLFNSEYNKTSFLSGAQRLVKKLPDGISQDVVRSIDSKSSVLAVPINDQMSRLDINSRQNSAIEIVWNHRWEFDKQPEVMFLALKKLKQKGYQFKLHVLGQSFRQVPDCFDSAKLELKEEIVTWGFQTRENYDAILRRADIVISTASHDFQGLSMLEAISEGCHPIAPNRVAYPEYIRSEDLYSIDSDKGEEQALCNKIIELMQLTTEQQSQSQLYYQETILRYLKSELVPKYNELIASMTLKMPKRD